MPLFFTLIQVFQKGNLKFCDIIFCSSTRSSWPDMYIILSGGGVARPKLHEDFCLWALHFPIASDYPSFFEPRQVLRDLKLTWILSCRFYCKWLWDWLHIVKTHLCNSWHTLHKKVKRKRRWKVLKPRKNNTIFHLKRDRHTNILILSKISKCITI